MNSLHYFDKQPNMSLVQAKINLRKEMLAARDSLDPVLKKQLDDIITEKVLEYIHSHPIKTIHTYISMGSEINLKPLIQILLDSGIRVIAPKSLPKRQLQNLELHSLDELETGIYGTSHPASGKEYNGNYDMILVPGLAYDKQGFRLGYGAGYYDTFLATQSAAIKVGICYSFQVVEKVPAESHDVQLDRIIY